VFKDFFNKRISTPIAIGIILILVLIVGGYTYWQYSEMQKEEIDLPEVKIPDKTVVIEKEKEVTSTEPKEKTSTGGIDISDWKTYRNEEYGFEIKYPKNWEIKEEKIDYVNIADSLVINIKSKDECDNGPYSEYLEDYNYYKKAGVFTVNNTDFYTIERSSGIMKMFDYCDFYVQRDAKCYILTFISPCDCIKTDESNKECQTFREILSSFRFLR